MSARFEDRVMRAIDALGGRTYAIPLQDKLNEGRWYSGHPLLCAVFGVNLGRLYVALYRLEQTGQLTSEWGTVRYPERGQRRRRYYQTQG